MLLAELPRIRACFAAVSAIHSNWVVDIVPECRGKHWPNLAAGLAGSIRVSCASFQT